MGEFDYKSFYEKVGTENGWDFSAVRVATEGARWDFREEAARRCRKSDVVLDIGTGGGEALLALAEHALLAFGIDFSASMIRTANANLKRAGRTNVRFLQMDAHRLAFPAATFDLVTCRHAPFDAAETARVLKEGGTFLTQQVGEGDKANLAQAFGRGQHTDGEGALRAACLSDLRQAGFADIQVFDYDAAEYYEREEDLLFLLKHAPIIPGFGEREEDFAALRRFVEANRTPRGIATNARRFLIAARK